MGHIERKQNFLITLIIFEREEIEHIDVCIGRLMMNGVADANGDVVYNRQRILAAETILQSSFTSIFDESNTARDR
jgi:hypothetical protein